MKKSYFLLLICFSFCLFPIKGYGSSHKQNLKEKILKVIDDKKLEIGVAIDSAVSDFHLDINGDKRYPMQSVFKFHLALAILKEVDNGNLSLKSVTKITKKDLEFDTWSPLKEKNRDGGEFTLSQLLKYMVSYSDNIACDVSLRLYGDIKKTNKYFYEMGIRDINIIYNEEEMSRNYTNQFSNWTTPNASNRLLKLFYNKKILSFSSHNFLWGLMKNSMGSNRIKGNLPKGIDIIHKTGTGSIHKGVYPAINDVGIVLINKKSYIISIFIKNSHETKKESEKLMADISRLVYDYVMCND